jgi:hypothetical protein
MLPFLSSRPCRKCGNKENGAGFCGEGTAYRRYVCRESIWPHPEHIRRRCPRCGYEWDEAPIDAAPAPPEGPPT